MQKYFSFEKETRIHTFCNVKAQGGPKVKSSETVYCRYCAKTGTERDCAKSMKKQLMRHMKQVHPELDPKLYQAWELIWTCLGSSRQTSASASPSLRNFFRVVPELPNIPSSSPLTDIPNSGQTKVAES